MGLHEGAVLTLTIDANGKRAASGGMDRKVTLWDVDGRRQISRGFEHPEEVTSIAFAPSGDAFYTGCGDRQVRAWTIADGQARWINNHEGRIFAVAASPDGKYVFSAGREGQVRRRVKEANRETDVLFRDRDPFHTLAIDSKGKTLFAAGKDRRISRWDLLAGAPLVDLTGHQDAVHALAVPPVGDYLLSAGSDRTVRVWDLRTGNELRRLENHPEPVYSLALLGEHGPAVAGGNNGTLVVWDWNTGKELGRQKLLSGVLAMAWTPKREEVVLGLADGSVWIAEPRRAATEQPHDDAK
jgi:WD40 repeat protein